MAPRGPRQAARTLCARRRVRPRPQRQSRTRVRPPRRHFGSHRRRQHAAWLSSPAPRRTRGASLAPRRLNVTRHRALQPPVSGARIVFASRRWTARAYRRILLPQLRCERAYLSLGARELQDSEPGEGHHRSIPGGQFLAVAALSGWAKPAPAAAALIAQPRPRRPVAEPRPLPHAAPPRAPHPASPRGRDEPPRHCPALWRRLAVLGPSQHAPREEQPKRRLSGSMASGGHLRARRKRRGAGLRLSDLCHCGLSTTPCLLGTFVCEFCRVACLGEAFQRLTELEPHSPQRLLSAGPRG